MAVPVAHFFAFGYLYALIEQARRGEGPALPPWRGWRRLFLDGAAAFLIFCVLGVLPVGIGWLLTWPLRPYVYGSLARLPMVPGLLVAAPLTAAGIYQYQKRRDFRDAFRYSRLAAMLESSLARLWVPTLALLGFLAMGYAFMTITLFVGLVVSFTFYAALFSAAEESRKAGPRSS